jgi:hypothetical protein
MGDKSLQIGDMGIGFRGVKLPAQDGQNYPLNHRFIRGNHDNPAECRRHPNYAGEYGYWDEEGLFFLGGAWSIDQQWRTEGKNWWRDEEQDMSSLGNAGALYCHLKPRIVATHEAPTVAAMEMLRGDIPVIMREYLEEFKTSLVHTDPAYLKYKENIGFKNTRTSQCLQNMLEFHQPEHWVFGHYHKRHNFEYKGTQFHCLPELDVMEIK